MRTKTLLIAAAALVAGIISSEAQVTSINVVGYVNLSVSNGFNAFTAAVDFDGTGTNNTVLNVFGTNAPVGSQILTWNGSSYAADNYVKPKSGPIAWSSPNTTINPGQGFFFNNPSNTTIVPVIGTVLQGGLTNSYITTAGFSFVGSQFPVPGGITTTYGYVPSVGDQVLTWNGSSYAANNYVKPKSGPVAWSSGEPQVGLGQAVFVNTTNTHPVWGTNFVVQ